MILEEVIAVLGYDLRGEENVRRFRNGLDRAASTVLAIGRKVAMIGAAVGAAAVAAGAGLSRFVGPVADEMDRLAKTADRVGVGVEALQGLRFAAEQTGVPMQALDMGLQRFSRRVAEAAKGEGVLKDVFEESGIALRDQSGALRDNVDLLGDYADLIANTESEQEQLRLAFKAFDSEGAALVNLFREGKIGIEEFRAELEELGGIMGEDAVQNAVDYQDQLGRLQWAFRGLRRRLALDIMPVMTEHLRGLEDWYRANRELVQAGLERVLRGTVSVMTSVAAVARSAGTAVRFLSGEIERLTGIGAGGQMAALGVGVGALLATRHPALAAIAAILLAIDDIVAYMQDRPSALGAVIEWLEGALEDLGVSFDDLEGVAIAALEPIRQEFEAIRASVEWLIDNVPRMFGFARGDGGEEIELAGGTRPRGIFDGLRSGWETFAEWMNSEAGTSGRRWGEIFQNSFRSVLVEKVRADQRIGSWLDEQIARAIEGARGRFTSLLSWLGEQFGNWSFPDLSDAFRPVLDVWNDIEDTVDRVLTALRGFDWRDYVPEWLTGLLGIERAQAEPREDAAAQPPAPAAPAVSFEAPEIEAPEIAVQQPPAPAAPVVIPSPIDVGRKIVDAARMLGEKIPAVTGGQGQPATPDPLGPMLQPLLNMEAALSQVSSGIDSFKPGDVTNNFDRRVTFEQSVTNIISQTVTGQASAGEAAQAVAAAAERAGRRAAEDIAAQEPSLDVEAFGTP